MAESSSEPKTTRCRNPKNGVYYVYTYESYFDPVMNKHRQRRRCIGKVDPESGEVVPTLPRGASRKRKTATGEPAEKALTREEKPPQYDSFIRQIQELKAKNQALEAELSKTRKEMVQEKASKERLLKAIENAIRNC